MLSITSNFKINLELHRYVSVLPHRTHTHHAAMELFCLEWMWYGIFDIIFLQSSTYTVHVSSVQRVCESDHVIEGENEERQADKINIKQLSLCLQILSSLFQL